MADFNHLRSALELLVLWGVYPHFDHGTVSKCDFGFVCVRSILFWPLRPLKSSPTHPTYMCMRVCSFSPKGVGLALERRAETKAVQIPAQVLAWGIAAAEASRAEAEKPAAAAAGATYGYVCVCGHDAWVVSWERE